MFLRSFLPCLRAGALKDGSGQVKANHHPQVPNDGYEFHKRFLWRRLGTTTHHSSAFDCLHGPIRGSRDFLLHCHRKTCSLMWPPHRRSRMAQSKLRKAKFYSITKRGRKQLSEDAAYWQRLSAVIGRVLALREDRGYE